MKPSAAQYAAILARIEFVRSELGVLAEYRDLGWPEYQRDRKARRNVERIAENVANATIDVAKILLATTPFPVPATYREVLETTVPAGLADEASATELVRLAQLRNTLSHRYLDYKWDGIKWFLRTGAIFVAEWLRACERVLQPPVAGAPSLEQPTS